MIGDSCICFYHRLLWKDELNLRSSHCSYSIKKDVLGNFINSTRKHLYRSPFLIELQTKRLKHRCFLIELKKKIKNWCLQMTASETCCFTWSVLKLAQIGTWFSLHEKCPNMEFSLVCIFQHLDWIRRDTSYVSVFSPNAGKYGPGKTSCLETFHAVFCIIIYSFICQFSLQY